MFLTPHQLREVQQFRDRLAEVVKPEVIPSWLDTPKPAVRPTSPPIPWPTWMPWPPPWLRAGSRTPSWPGGSASGPGNPPRLSAAGAGS
jgi:hypothetical protein